MPTLSDLPRLVILLTACGYGGSVMAAPEPATQKLVFELDVMPILTAAGCNIGHCHGKSRGQNGFALSLLGFDADFDYASIVKEARGRRVFPAAPDESLLLRKASAQRASRRRSTLAGRWAAVPNVAALDRRRHAAQRALGSDVGADRRVARRTSLGRRTLNSR